MSTLPARRGGNGGSCGARGRSWSAIKDALVLIVMLLFFGLLFAALDARPSTTAIKDGALVLELDGPIVEQPSEPTAFAALSGQRRTRAVPPARRGPRARRRDGRCAGQGGGARSRQLRRRLSRGARRGRRRARRGCARAGKPVLAYATAYTDGGYLLAANASEIWVNPMGGTLFTGPGGNQLYYKGLIDKLGVNVHVYRVGKLQVVRRALHARRPVARGDGSGEQALYGALFGQWQEADRQGAAQGADRAVPDRARRGDRRRERRHRRGQSARRAGRQARRPDRVRQARRGARRRDAEQAGGQLHRRSSTTTGSQANPLPTGGDAIGVVTVAGEIVDGKAGPGTAARRHDRQGGARRAGQEEAEGAGRARRFAGRIGAGVGADPPRDPRGQGAEAAGRRVDGRSRRDGGYWVSTPGDVIFAEPDTITGSIGIFGIIPTFENTLAKIGVTSDGVKTTPLSGQPDVIGGTTPRSTRSLQSAIENGYRAVHRARRAVAQDDAGAGRRDRPGPRLGRRHRAPDRAGRPLRRRSTMRSPRPRKRAKLDPAKVHAGLSGEEAGLARAAGRAAWRRRRRRRGRRAGAAATCSRGSRPSGARCWRGAGRRAAAGDGAARSRRAASNAPGSGRRARRAPSDLQRWSSC